MKVVDFHPAAQKTIKEFPTSAKKKIGEAIHMLQIGKKLSMPLSRPIKAVQAGAEEIRCKDLSGVYRIFYFTRKKNRIIIFHAFMKKTKKTPKNEIKTAKQRLKEVING